MKILVTGERNKESLPAALNAETPIEWLELPVLEFEKIPVAAPTLTALAERPADWILFTSARGARFWSDTWLETGLDFPLETQVACIGETTAEAASQDGFNPDFYPTEPGSEKFLEEFEDLLSNNSVKPRIVIPMAEGGRMKIAERLKELGCKVQVIALYRTHSKTDLAEALTPAQIESLNALLFTSPSSVEAYLAHFSVPANAKVFALGIFTETSLLEHGLSQARIVPGGDLHRLSEVW